MVFEERYEVHHFTRSIVLPQTLQIAPANVLAREILAIFSMCHSEQP